MNNWFLPSQYLLKEISNHTKDILYFINNIDNDVIIKKSRSALIYNSVLFVLFLLSFLISIFLSNGYSYVSEGKYVFLEKYKYLKNLIEMPFIGLSFITGIILVLYGIIITLLKSSTKGIWYTGIGVFLTIFSLFITLAFNNTCYYPSKIDFQSSLTIENSSSSYYTLNIMSYVTVLIPIVVAYIYWAWKSINNKKINDEELEETEHKY